MDDLLYVYATAAVIGLYFCVQVATKRFDPFAPVWLFFVGYVQVYIIQAISYHGWALAARGQEAVAAANFRALWALLWFLAVYHLGIGRGVARRLPNPPRNWSTTVVVLISPILIVWGMYCAGVFGGGAASGGPQSAEAALLGSFPFVMMVAGVLLIVTGRRLDAPNPVFLYAGLAVTSAYVVIWMFNGKRSHSLIGVLATVCAYYSSHMKRPSWGVLAGTSFAGALVVSLAIGWRNNPNYERTFSGFAQFVGDFRLSKILESLDIADEETATEMLTYETKEYGGFLLMMDAVPMKSDYDYGASYIRSVSTFIPRLIWTNKPLFGRKQWVDAWIASSEMERDEDFTGPAIGILGATQLNGGAVGTLIVLGVIALVLRSIYDYCAAPRRRPLGAVHLVDLLFQRLVHGRLRRPDGLVLLQLGLLGDAHGRVDLVRLQVRRPRRGPEPGHRASGSRPGGGRRRVSPRAGRRASSPSGSKAHARTVGPRPVARRIRGREAFMERKGLRMTTSPIPPSTDARRDRRTPRYSLNEKIDVCRGLFAYLVVAAHAFELSCTLDPRWGESLPEAVRLFLAYGSGTGVYYVMGFFVLSGYCIQSSVQRMTSDDGFPLKTYMIARLTRILPLYYLALLFAAVVESAMVSWAIRPTVWRNGLSGRVLLCQTFLIQNFTQTFGSFAPSWSITNEVAYYILFGLIAAVCVPLRLRPSIAGMGLCVAVGLVLQIVYRAGFHHPAVLGTGLLFGLGSLWFLGALTAENKSGFRDAPRLRAVARAWPLALGLSIGMWCCQRVHQEFVFLCAGGAFTLMLIHFIGQEARDHDHAPNKPRRALRRFIAFLGLTSYPTYLFHGPLLLAFGGFLQDSGVSTPWWGVWPAASVFAIACSAPLAFLVERPLMAWRAGFLKRLKSAPDTRPSDSPSPSPILGIQQ